MISQVILTSKSFTANVTWEWSLVGVCPLMDQQIVRLGKMATTIFTDVLFLCPENAINHAIKVMMLLKIIVATRYPGRLNSKIGHKLILFFLLTLSYENLGHYVVNGDPGIF